MQEQKKRRKQRKSPIRCEYCGKQISRGRFCNKSCSRAWWREQEQFCPVCEKTFSYFCRKSPCPACASTAHRASTPEPAVPAKPANFDDYFDYRDKYQEQTGKHISYGEYQTRKRSGKL